MRLPPLNGFRRKLFPSELAGIELYFGTNGFVYAVLEGKYSFSKLTLETIKKGFGKTRKMPNTICYFDITIADSPAGRITFELFDDVVPKVPSSSASDCPSR